MAQASQVLANYTTANNTANAQRSDSVLATIETGSSYAVDAGLYRTQQAENAATYPAFGPQREQYYIPRETAYPRWFVVQVANAELSAPTKITGTEYLLFTQAGPGAPWKNTVEPYVLGLPFAMFWVVMWVVAAAAIMAVVYRLDERDRARERGDRR